MNRFAFATPATHAEAASLLQEKRYTLPVLKAGGLDVLDHMKEGLMEPDLLINIRRLRSQASPVTTTGEGAGLRIVIDATATLSEIASSAAMLKHAPVVAQAAGSAATPQVRNFATAAGNVLQRPRC
ncbi:MAG: FAD binding domain-containing protein, partial [Phycisphaerales bacterium]